MTMRCALIQTNPLVGAVERNAEAILQACLEAASQGAQLCVTPELGLIGYPPQDLLLFPDLARRADRAALELAARLGRDAPETAVVLGSIGRNRTGQGKHLYNQALFLAGGEIQARYSKWLLPTYDVFDECRYFEPGTDPVVVAWHGRRIALTVCEDIWNEVSFRYGRDPVVASAPFDLLVNISASPFVQGKQAQREAMLAQVARRCAAEVIYVNQAGGNDELVFDGRSMRLDAAGKLTHRAEAFAPCMLVTGSEPDIAADDPAPESEIWRALVLGTRDYCVKNGLKSALVGLSGGIDSSLVAAVACAALGPDRVTGLLLPSPWSSDHSLLDAAALAANLGMRWRTVPIEPGMQACDSMLTPLFNGPPAGLTAENLQARLRGILLMAESNRSGSLLLTTGNKSEIAVGYCTVYGDMCGGLAVIADLFKTQVYGLCRWLNRDKAVIPENILLKAPSAELRPGQTDQDSLPPYDQLDDILQRLLFDRQSVPDVCAAGHALETVQHVAGLVSRAEFKRHQAAPGLKISEQAFGIGWRLPITCQPPYLQGPTPPI